MSMKKKDIKLDAYALPIDTSDETIVITRGTGKNINKQTFKKKKVRYFITELKDVRLENHNFRLVVNEKLPVPFNSKKSAGEAKGTKEFKALEHLWEYRTVIKNGKNIRLKGVDSDFVTLHNLKAMSGCATDGAARQVVKRLRKILNHDYGLPIFIEEERGKYRLIIQKGMA